MAVESAEEGAPPRTVEDAEGLGGVLDFVADRLTARRLLLISDSRRVVGRVLDAVDGETVLATSDADLREDFADEVQTVLRLSVTLPSTLEVLEDVRGILISAFLEGSLGEGQDVLCLVAGDDHPLLLFNFSISDDPTFEILRAGIDERCDLEVFEMLLRIAGDLVRQGREGRSVGTMFIVGDTENVLEASRQVVINPFQGHTAEQRRVLHPDNVETTKEYANLDGAIVVSADGTLEAAGRYVLLEPDAEAASGLGGRHLAAASVTMHTDAVAIVVSSSGVVRVYKDGSPVMELDGF
jgi:hypothetical protein